MRTIEWTTRFKGDYKREKKGRHRATLDKDLDDVLSPLAADISLPDKNRDHPLAGDWKGCRDCHIKPDLVLIYRKTNDNVLQLVRLGFHSELSL